MHSSRMHTARLHSPMGEWGGEGGVVTWSWGEGGVVIWSGGGCCHLVPGGGRCCDLVLGGGRCCDLVPGGGGVRCCHLVLGREGGVVTWSGWEGRCCHLVPGGGRCCHLVTHLPLLRVEVTHTCENITFARFATQAVKIGSRRGYIRHCFVYSFQIQHFCCEQGNDSSGKTNLFEGSREGFSLSRTVAFRCLMIF